MSVSSDIQSRKGRISIKIVKGKKIEVNIGVFIETLQNVNLELQVYGSY
ncbi:hypothetical protein K4R64_04950 [Staphylococcus epidermidis]|nr:hypothetical protein [Staphylococcus epidermidis]TIC94665.1 hypothetical protein SEVCU112_1720 [Staphylococcus epidermidis VCU112]